MFQIGKRLGLWVRDQSLCKSTRFLKPALQTPAVCPPHKQE